MVDRLRAHYRPGTALHVCALHVCTPQRARRVLAAVAAWRAPDTAYVGEFDVAMAAHRDPASSASPGHWLLILKPTDKTGWTIPGGVGVAGAV